MQLKITPQAYEAWYATPRGAWMGCMEAQAMTRLLGIGPQTTLLDVGCGSGWFSRRFATRGSSVYALDPDSAMLAFAHRQNNNKVRYMQGDMLAIPLPDHSVDVVTAVTSLCFVSDQPKAVSEMLRVARHSVVLGLLHRYSLLYLAKHGRGAYAGAHWHTRTEVRTLCLPFIQIKRIEMESLLFWPGNPTLGRVFETLPLLPRSLGAFLAVKLVL